MSSLAHRSAAAPASTSRAGRHERRTCLVRLRLHLTVVSQRCSSAPAASRGASSCALRCCSSSESTLTAAISALLRAQVEDEWQLLPTAMALAADGRHRLVHRVAAALQPAAAKRAGCPCGTCARLASSRSVLQKPGWHPRGSHHTRDAGWMR